jgi:hypothetical protein
VPPGEILGLAVALARKEARIEHLNNVHLRRKDLGELSATPLPSRIRVREERDPTLIADPPTALDGRSAARYLLRKVEPDNIDPLRGANFLTGDHTVGIPRRKLEGNAKTVMICDRDPANSE